MYDLNSKLPILCCYVCKGILKKTGNSLTCLKCEKTYLIDRDLIRTNPDLSDDMKVSLSKWNAIYQDELSNKVYQKNFENYKKLFLKDTVTQIESVKKLGKNDVYLEIGCGLFFLGQELAEKTGLVIGVDLSIAALEIAKTMLKNKGITNYLLIQGDILKLPINEDSVDLIYGGGVIEHFKDTQSCVNEMYRVLKIEGVSFNTVPYLNIGSLTYRQLWGNIPNLPILSQIAEFIHFKLLKGKHTKFGYEMSFMSSTLINLHKRAGFNDVKVDRFKVKIAFDFLPNYLKPIFIWLATHSKLFWPMVKVSAKKT